MEQTKLRAHNLLLWLLLSCLLYFPFIIIIYYILNPRHYFYLFDKNKPLFFGNKKESFIVNETINCSSDADKVVEELKSIAATPGASVNHISFKTPDGKEIQFSTPEEVEKYFSEKDELDLSSLGGKPTAVATLYRNYKTRNTDKCPYCGYRFDSPPVRAKKCPKCGEKFYVRVGNRLFDSDLLKDGDAQASDCFRDMMNFGVSVLYAKELKNKLEKKFGSEPNPRDIIWGICRNFPLTKKDDPVGLFDMSADLCFQLARYELACGRDPKNVLEWYIHQNIEQCKIHKKANGDTSDYIYINSESCCDICRERHGKKVKISDALEKMPLPFSDCQNKMNPSDKYYFCKSYYTWFN